MKLNGNIIPPVNLESEANTSIKGEVEIQKIGNNY